jgi:uncharacterized protein (DUF305 family)
MHCSKMVFFALLASLPALAQTARNDAPMQMHDMPMHMHEAPQSGKAAAVDTDQTRALKQADAEMMRRMDVPLTGDADRDFVATMLPHHEGAVDMARIELQYGRDPELRALAEAIIKAQMQEIALMIRWQETHDKPSK